MKQWTKRPIASSNGLEGDGSMFKYTVKRLFQSLITVLLVVSAVFLLLRLLPTDYFFTEDQLIKLDEHEQEDMLRIAGYLDPPFVQLGNFYANLVKTEHQPHYFERINAHEDGTVEIKLLEANGGKGLKAEDVTFQCVEERPQVKTKTVAVAEEAGKENVLLVTTKEAVQADRPYRVSMKEQLRALVTDASVSEDAQKPNTLIIKTGNEVEHGFDYTIACSEYPELKGEEITAVAEAENTVTVKMNRTFDRGLTYTVTCGEYTGSFKASGYGSDLDVTAEGEQPYFESVNIRDGSTLQIKFSQEGAAAAVSAENIVVKATEPVEHEGTFEFWGDEAQENISFSGGTKFFHTIAKIDPTTYELTFAVQGGAACVDPQSISFKSVSLVMHEGTFTIDGQTGEATIAAEEEVPFFQSIRMIDETNFELAFAQQDAVDNTMAVKSPADQLTFRCIEPFPVITAQEVQSAGNGLVTVRLDQPLEKKTDYLLTCGDHTGDFEIKKIGVNVQEDGWEKTAKINNEKTTSVMDHLKHIRIWLNFGESRRVQTGKPVVEIIGGKMVVSLSIGLAALAIALLVGVPLGILQARYKDGFFDAVGQGYTIFINAVPHLVTYFLIMIIGNRLFKLPISYASQNPLLSSVLPVISLAMGSIASYMLWMRRYMVDELNKDYIRLAKLKGMSTTQVMFRHVMKNAFLPLAQYLPYSVLLTVGGSILVEKMFGVPGLGSLLPDAIAKYDTNLVQAVVSLYASLGILGLFLGDVLMIVLDPRIRLTEKGGTR